MFVESPAAPETEQSPNATWLAKRRTDASIPGKQSMAKPCLTGTSVYSTLTICRGLFAKCTFALHRPILLELRSKPECQKPPEDWDLSHSRYALQFQTDPHAGLA